MVKVAASSLLLVAAAVQANPIFRRQEVSSASEVSSALASSASDLVSSAIGSASAVPSESASASAAPSASASASPEYPAFPCPQGLLTYVQVQQAYPGVPLEAAVEFLSNWSSAVPYPIVNSTGTNETGATRTYTVEGLDISEVLINQTINATTGALYSDFNLTSPISTAGLTIYSAANSLAYYTNETTSESTAQVFSNFCASDQEAGAVAFEQLLTGTLAAYGALLSGASGSASGVASSAASSAPVESASSAASGAASSVVDSASGALESATSVVASAAPSA